MNRYEQSGARVSYFDRFESREDAFNRSVFDLIPCTYGGPSRFWRDFRRITADGMSRKGMGQRVCITSDPRDCLAYGTPRQVLTAAAIRTGCAGTAVSDKVSAVAVEYGLMQALDQPVRTLSGGETVMLALARALVAAATSQHLAIASPFSWLSRENDRFFRRVVERYHQSDRPVDVFALTGEDRIDPVPIGGGDPSLIGTADLFLECTGLAISLRSPVTVMTAPPVVARVSDVSCPLVSPCLIEGGNGQGKSLIARAFCGSVARSGTVRLQNASGTGRPRLLLQDVIGQTLLRSRRALLPDDTVDCRRVQDCIRRLRDFHGAGTGASHPPPNGTRDDVEAPLSLLDIKHLLIALRLCHHPSVLILDEPDWGLSRDDAVTLVVATISEAHRRGVPVMLISHKPWWQAIARSRLKVSKQAETPGGQDGLLFTIDLEPEPAS